MITTLVSFPLIYNNKKAIPKLDGKVIDLPSWNITYASGHTRLSPPIEVWQVMRCMREVRRSQSPANTHSIRLSNKTGIMGKRLASKVMSAVFALALQCGTKAIFWRCTHAKCDSHAPESPMPGEMCWAKSASLNPHIYTDTHTNTNTNTPPSSAPINVQVHKNTVHTAQMHT